MVMVLGASVIASAGVVSLGLQRMRGRPVMRAELLSLGFVMMVVALCVLPVLLESMTRRFAGWDASSWMRVLCVCSSAWMILVSHLGLGECWLAVLKSVVIALIVLMAVLVVPAR